MGVRVEVGVGPLRWSKPVRLPRAQRNALNLIGCFAYVCTLAALWLAFAVAMLCEWRYSAAIFVADGVLLGVGVWWLGRRVRTHLTG